jgi:hypothetical protein
MGNHHKLKMHIIDEGIPVIKKVGTFDELDELWKDIRLKYRGRK